MLLKFSISGLSFEVASIALLLQGGNGLLVLGGYLLLHLASSALFALAIATVAPQRYRQPRKWLLVYLFFFNFFIPVGGALAAVAALLVAVFWPKDETEDHFDTQQAPAFVTARRREGSGFSGNRVRAQLGSVATPVDKRLNALVAIQSTPTRASGASLRNLLGDPADDVRLLAYGILDGKEKKITQRIVDTRHQLKDSDDPPTRLMLHQQIAELYQELIYQNLVQGDLLQYACEQIREHTHAALEIDPSQPALWFILLRLELMSGDIAAARLAQQRAQEHGYSRVRLLPYLAELSYLERDYEQVRKLFIEMSIDPSMSSNPQLHRFWRHGRRTIANRLEAFSGGRS